VPPLGGTPRLPTLHDRLPRKGLRPLGLEDAVFVEPLTEPRPLRAEVAATPLAEHSLVARCRIDREVN